jgi:asparagine synthase (glutamine-hydrolysing)
MCGIAGVYYFAASPPNPGAAPIERMTDSLAHRGPDDSGVYRGERVMLGHRRLAILDISAAGHQPMSDESGTVWIVYNGEIYNFRELRRELESCGCRFRTQTDTEVILHAYRQWGLEAVRRFNGMFAFALWDEAKQRLWLARDPIGLKPLFYSDRGGVLRFGSEIKAILADPDVPRDADLRGLDAFFTFGYTPAPYTGFAAVRQLLPGHQLVVQSASLSVSRYYRLPYPDRPPPAEPLEQAVERFRGELLAAVRRQMVSDVPLGAFLSGGVDSSSVVWGMRHSSDEKPLAFCAGFDESSFDETPYARQVAEALGIELHSRRLSADAAALLPAIVSHAEEPLADNSMIPLYLLSAFARERVKVALSGDGGDELLAGYITYKASRWANWYRRLPGPIRRGVVRPLVESLPASQTKYGAAMLARRFVEGAENPPLADHCSWRQIISPREKQTLYLGEMRSAVKDFDPIAEYAACADDAPDWLSPLERRLHVDLTFHLPNDMLVKVDRMSMAHGLEVRAPFLDLELVKTCLSLPPHYKLRGGTGKYILKKCLEGELPQPVLRRKKAGFLVPLEKWLRGPLLPLVRESLSPQFLHETGLLSPQRVATMIEQHASGRRDHAYPLFTLLVFAAWWRKWVSG